MQEFLESEEFRRYRKAQIAEILSSVNIFDVNNIDEMKGALEMARKIIKLPLKLVKGKKNKENLNIMILEDIKEFEYKFVKSNLE